MAQEYASPPLVEAVFEAFADETQQNTWTEQSFLSIGQHFPEFGGAEETLELSNLTLKLGPGTGFSQAIQPSPRRIRRWDPPRQRAIQFAANMCAYNILGSGYGRFDNHTDLIARTLSFYTREAAPQNVWLGQRYINAIKVLASEKDISSYFIIYPQLPSELQKGHPPFALQVKTADFEAGEVYINFSLNTLATDAATYVLDIYARSTQMIPADAEALLEWQRKAHVEVNKSFELSISDKTRQELFGGEKTR